MKLRRVALATVIAALLSTPLSTTVPAHAADPAQYDAGNIAEQWTGRSLGIAHAPNLRDVGGYRTIDGQWVDTGIAYRSGALGGLDATDWQQLRARGVDHVVDLRNPSERKDDPDVPPAGVGYQVADVEGAPQTLGDIAATLHCAGLGTALGALSILGSLDDPGDVLTAEGYLLEACYGGSMAAFRDLMHALGDSDETVVFHCSAGKDRTGVATAILLTILGVPQATVLDDFTASNYYRGAGSVQREWLQQWFQAVKLDWGSFDGFVKNGLHLTSGDVAALKARFLVPTKPAALS